MRDVYRGMPGPLRRLLRLPVGKMVILSHYRAAVRRRPFHAVKFLLFDRELDNFTYDISNTQELASFIADLLGSEPATIGAFLKEVDSDVELNSAIESKLASRPDRNRRMPFGRRLGWYAIIRETKPKLVVETGVHDGLGSSLMLRALHRNAEEGNGGHLIGIDIDPSASWLVPEFLRERFTFVHDDSQRALARLPGPFDVFVHDSEHSYKHEASELALVESKLAPRGILISDNAHATTALADFSRDRSRRFELFREQVVGHFYPGAGIGVSVATES